LAALVGAAFAGVGAALAVVGVMTAALGAARLTDFGAQAAEFERESRTPAHEPGREEADRGAVAVEPDALGHGRDIVLVEAGAGAVFAFLGAGQTGFDTGLMLVV
jgi:hypothetical protein